MSWASEVASQTSSLPHDWRSPVFPSVRNAVFQEISTWSAWKMCSATLQHKPLLPVPWGFREALSSKYHWFRLLHPCWLDVTLVLTSCVNIMYINLMWGCSKGLAVHDLVKIVWHPTWLGRAWASPTLTSITRLLPVNMYIYMVRPSFRKLY